MMDFERSIRVQIEMNRARTPDQRFDALCQLLEELEAFTPQDSDAQKRRQLIQDAKERERERFRAEWSKLFAAYRASQGV
jgi:hypothetical protein